MKRKIFIIAGVILLLAAVAFMAKDLFMPKDSPKVMADAVDSLKTGDAPLLYRPLFSFSPEMEKITGITAYKDDLMLVCGKYSVESYDYRGKKVSSFPLDEKPTCITYDDKGDIYVGFYEHIVIFDRSGKEKKRIETGDTSSWITSIAVSGKEIFIADAGLKTVLHYDISGKMKGRIGNEDPEKGIESFVIPSPYFDIASEQDGSLWVTNPGRHLLENFTVSGEMVKKWGFGSMTVDGFCGCCNPSSFTILSDGSFITGEKSIPRVKIYDKDGSFMGLVAGPDQFEEETKGLDLARDSNDRIYVLDPIKKKVTVYVRT
jgi:hypothetical protein